MDTRQAQTHKTIVIELPIFLHNQRTSRKAAQGKTLTESTTHRQLELW